MRRTTVWVVSLLVGSGCVSTGGSGFPSDARLRPASDVPARFEPRDPALRLTAGDTIVGSGCLTPLVDPRDGRTLVLVRSVTPRGDYRAPLGSYGAGEGELVRLDCNTGAVLGIVPR